MRHLFALFLAALGLLGCSDGGVGPGEAVIPAELVGSWEASPGCLPDCGLTLVRVDKPADSLNFVSSLGATFLLNVTAAGGFHLNDVLGGNDITGQARAEGTMLVLRDGAGAQDTADYVVSGAYLSLAFRAITDSFDFDADGTGDPAVIRATFRRR